MHDSGARRLVLLIKLMHNLRRRSPGLKCKPLRVLLLLVLSLASVTGWLMQQHGCCRRMARQAAVRPWKTTGPAARPCLNQQ